MLLRSTWSQGFRAPSILELYQGKRQTNFPAVDPCNGGGSGQPGCAGVPNGYHQGQFNSGLIAGVTAGNRDLRPDSADTYSIGAGYSTRSRTSAYSFTVDRFRIKIRDAIAAQSATSILQSCARTGAFCSLVQRGANGEVVQLTQAVVNLAQIEVQGIDATMHYVFPARGAKVDAAVDVAYLQRYRSSMPQPDGSVAIDDRAGKSDQPRSSFPRVKAQASVRYIDTRYQIGWKARHIGGSADLPANPVNGGRVASVWYQDLQGNLALTGALQLSLGVDNVLDTQPPASAANNPVNFDIYTYDVRGRYFYARLSAKF
jgi:outer membrane receptor protein involved in Fe transport